MEHNFFLLRIFFPLFLFCFSPVAAATELLSESFSACELPENWEVENLGGDCRWIFDSNRQNETGGEGCYAMASSEDCSSGTSMDTVLFVSPVDCSRLTETTLSFQYDAYEQLNASTFAVEISLDEGNDWSQIWVRNQSDPGPKTAVLDISAEADRRPSVLIRFRYTASAKDWWWQVDDVQISGKKGKNR
ncbi:MAG: choice-of-anchor J domain-containing protein [Candidatus Electrothrix sp. YB6]